MATPDAESCEPSRSDGSEEKMYPYSRDQYVAAITEFYELVTSLYIPRSALKFPPPGGWPNITPENCAGFGKSDFVVDLLKHLPYISGGRVILLDTAAGEAIEEVIRCDRVDQDDVLAYFAKLAESYRTLRLLPVPGYHVIDDMGYVDDVPGDQLPEPIADSASEFPTETDFQWLCHI